MAGMMKFAGKIVWSIPECLECEELQQRHWINPLTYLCLLQYSSSLPLHATSLHS